METPLPDSALPVWTAYEAMGESKRRHFDYLQYLEEKYEPYGRPSAEENAKLKALLQEHDARVGAFKSALNQLKISDPGAYAALIMRFSAQA